VYAVVIRFIRVIRAAICIGRHIRVPVYASLKGLISYDNILSVFQISYSFVDREHKIIEKSVIIFTRLHVVTNHKTPIFTVFPVKVTTFYGLNDKINIFVSHVPT
jgi:hypothetical protein